MKNDLLAIFPFSSTEGIDVGGFEFNTEDFVKAEFFFAFGTTLGTAFLKSLSVVKFILLMFRLRYS